MYDSLLLWLLILVLKRERKKRHFNIFAFNIQVQVAWFDKLTFRRRSSRARKKIQFGNKSILCSITHKM